MCRDSLGSPGSEKIRDLIIGYDSGEQREGRSDLRRRMYGQRIGRYRSPHSGAYNYLTIAILVFIRVGSGVVNCGTWDCCAVSNVPIYSRSDPDELGRNEFFSGRILIRRAFSVG